MALIAKIRGSVADRGTRASLTTHPIKSIVVLPAVVIAIFALDWDIIIRYRPPRLGQCGKREITTYDFLEMVLAEESVCDLDSRRSVFRHALVTKEDGCAEVTDSKSALGLKLEGGWW